MQKIYSNKGQNLAYNKAREIIDSKTSMIEDASLFQEQQDLLHEGLTSRPIGRKLARQRMNARKFKAKENMTKKLFMENFFDLYKQCLLLDEDFIYSKENNLYKLCEDTFNNLLEEGIISWDGIKRDSSKFVTNLYALCEAAADKNATMNVNADSVKKAKVSDDAIINEKDKEKDEEVDSKDKKKIDDETKEDKKKVAKAVKQKVIDTVKKEKEASEKEEAEDEEIKEKSKTKKEKEEDSSKEDTTDSSTDDTSTADDTSAEKDTSSDSGEKNDVTDEADAKNAEEDTSSEESTEKNDVTDEADAKNAEEEKSSEDSKKSESFSFGRKLSRPNKMRNNSLFRSIQINVGNKMINEHSARLNEDVSIDMDMIFAETLAYYTLLETMNTIRLIDMSTGDLKKLSKQLILHK